jgi:hypothetical protein
MPFPKHLPYKIHDRMALRAVIVADGTVLAFKRESGKAQQRADERPRRSGRDFLDEGLYRVVHQFLLA